MKLNINQLVTTLDGQPMKDGEHDLYLKQVFSQALIAPKEQGKKKQSIKESMDANALAEKIWSANEFVDVTLEEINLIKSALEDVPYIPRVKAIAGMAIEVATS